MNGVETNECTGIVAQNNLETERLIITEDGQNAEERNLEPDTVVSDRKIDNENPIKAWNEHTYSGRIGVHNSSYQPTKCEAVPPNETTDYEESPVAKSDGCYDSAPPLNQSSLTQTSGNTLFLAGVLDEILKATYIPQEL